MAAEKEHIKSMHYLANLYKIKENNIIEAKKWYCIAIEKGDIQSINNLAIIYEEIDKNIAEA